MLPFLAADNRLLGIAENRYIRIVRGENELREFLAIQKLMDEMAVERLVIEIVLRLIDENDRVAAEMHEDVEDHGSPLAEGVISKRFALVEDFRHIRRAEGQEIRQMVEQRSFDLGCGDLREVFFQLRTCLVKLAPVDERYFTSGQPEQILPVISRLLGCPLTLEVLPECYRNAGSLPTALKPTPATPSTLNRVYWTE